MKCTQPDARRSAQVSILINGKTCDEYGAHQEGDNIFLCYIPVLDNERFSIKTIFNGVTPKAQIDVYIDGQLRNCFSFSRAGKYKKKSREFEEAYCKAGNHIAACYMKFKECGANEISNEDDGSFKDFGPGTICVRYSVADDGNEEYDVEPLPTGLTEAPNDDEEEVYTSQSSSTHRVVFESDTKSPLRSQSQLKKLRRSVDQKKRPGSQLWGTFCFIYRSLDSIRAANYAKTKQGFRYTNDLPTTQSIIDAVAKAELANDDTNSISSIRDDELHDTSIPPEQQEQHGGGSAISSPTLELSAANLEQGTTDQGEQPHSPPPITSKRAATTDSDSISKRVKADVVALRASLEKKRHDVAEAKKRAAEAQRKREKHVKERDEAKARLEKKAEQYRREMMTLDTEWESVLQAEEQAIEEAEDAAEETQELENEGAGYDTMLVEQ